MTMPPPPPPPRALQKMARIVAWMAQLWILKYATHNHKVTMDVFIMGSLVFGVAFSTWDIHLVTDMGCVWTIMHKR